MSVRYYEPYFNNIYQINHDRYYLVNNKNNMKRDLNRRLCDIKIYKFNISINNLLKIINNILSDFCDAKVIGYNTTKNIHWCKIFNDKLSCSLHIELEILLENKYSTEVKFNALIGDSSLMEDFVLNFTESIELYRTSVFIKGCLEKNL